MSFSRYNIEKKQISTDNGVHWVDVEPAETQKGALVGVARTLLECEDMACELEEDRFTIVDGELPDEICGEFYIPEGIIKYYTFTAGAICCNTWLSSGVKSYDYLYGTYSEISTGHRVCGGGYCPGWDYSSNILQNGMDLRSICLEKSCYAAPYGLCPCITIDEFMPWAEGKTTWKLIQKQHYSRQHCSDEWEVDGEPEVVGVAERWKFITDDFYSETWQYQVAESFDASGNVTSWVSSGSPEITYFDSTLPEGLELMDELRSDGAMLTSSCSLRNQIGDIQLRRGNYTTTISGNVVGGVSSDVVSSTTLSYYNIPASTEGRLCDVFFVPVIDEYHCNTNPATGSYIYCEYIKSASNVLDGICTGIIRQNGVYSFQDKTGTLFPYRIPAPTMGMEDDYYNGSEYGYLRRDGSRYPMGYIEGCYTDASGNTKHIATSPELPGSYGRTWRYSTPIPSNVVSITSTIADIPSDYMNSHTSLSSVTLSNTISIGNRAFSGTTNLHTIAFPNSLRTIGNEAFTSGGLSAVSFNNVETVGRYAFQDCQQLVSVDFGTALTGISEYCFYGDSGLTNVVIPGSVTEIGGYSFSGCANIEYVTINNSEYTYIRYGAFKGCRIKELTINSEMFVELYSSDSITFVGGGVILVPASMVDTYKTADSWKDFAYYIHPIPTETRWVKRYTWDDYETKQGRNTDYSNDWFYLPEYRTVG